ncbi:MAG: prolyl oligopeptidase family serine peptidase [Myxococcota bacterium]|nr:prolyl oligopeptidase family serine peptidase [Myxococcota bacterium]MDW8362521.1 prolyl oligopeptidase family serine peptidase [Myxococcales bacterium]
MRSFDRFPACLHAPHVALGYSLLASLAACGADCPRPRAAPTPSAVCETAAPSPQPTPPTPPDAAATAPAPDTRTVVLEGTPEVPPELLARLDRYLETRSAVAQSLTEDGRHLLVLTRFANTAQVHEVRAPLGARRQLTFLDDPVVAAAYVPRQSQALVFQTDVGGDENYQIHRLDRQTGESVRLTDGRSRNAAFAFSDDGSRLFFSSNARNGRDMDIWESDGRDPASARLLLETRGQWSPLEVSRDGRFLLLQEWISIRDVRLHVLDLQTRVLERISPETPVASWRRAAFSPDGRTLYAISDVEGEWVELYETSVASPASGPRRFRPLSRDVPWNVEHLAVAPDGRTVAFVTNEDGWSVLRLLDTRSRRHRVVRELPRGVVLSLQFARGAPVLALTLSTASSTADAYVYDLRTRRIARWTESEMGGLDPTRFVEPVLVRFTSFDGRSIPALYYRPPGTGPFPVLVDIHGGPEAQSRPLFHPLAQYFVRERATAVLVPNVRGSDGYGKSYLALDDGRLREDAVRDIGALLDWIGRQSELDAARVAVMGGSYGGYMVLASLVHHGERLAAGIDVVGIANFVTFLEATAEYRRDLRRVEYGDERDPEMRAFLTAISPVTRASEIRRPLFVAHGTNDPRVPLAEAEQIAAAVRANGHEVWTMVARNEGHGFRRKDNRDLFTSLAVLFLERHLRLPR